MNMKSTPKKRLIMFPLKREGGRFMCKRIDFEIKKE